MCAAFKNFPKIPAGADISFLNVDVEGHDLEVLKSNNWELFRPELVCVELHSNSIFDVIESKIFNFMTDVSYELIAWTKPSLIFKRK